MQVIVESAIELTKTQKTDLEKKISTKLTNPQITYNIDPNIIGGLRIQVGAQVVDLSLKAKLNQLQQNLS